jgi:hypothetical protein
MWDCLRNTEDVMRHVYSFLSVYDRVHLAEVDKTFRDAEARGRVVGIYGDEGLDLLQAFETIKKWHDFEISPKHQMDEAIVLYRGDDIQIKAEWYTPEGGWDLGRILVRQNFIRLQGKIITHSKPLTRMIHSFLSSLVPLFLGSQHESDFRYFDEREEAFQFYSRMNEDRFDMKRMKEEILQTYYERRPVLAPYNTLFNLLEKHDLGRLADQFMKARESELDGDDDCDGDSVMMYDEWDETGENICSTTVMPHLRPGRNFLPGSGCKPILLKKCDRDCQKIKENVKTEYCGCEHCPGFNVCRACTDCRSCASCGRNVNCPVQDCPNECSYLMCQCSRCQEEWNDPSCCGFVLKADDDDDDSAEQMQA